MQKLSSGDSKHSFFRIAKGLMLMKSHKNSIEMGMVVFLRATKDKDIVGENNHPHTGSRMSEGRHSFIREMNVAGVFVSPKPMTANSNCPKGLLTAVLGFIIVLNSDMIFQFEF